MLTLEKFEQASETVKKVTKPTKLVYSEYLSEQTGGKVYLKPENMQHTGAYKLRGAYYKISTLSKEEKKRGIITASAGNHAQGVAYAAKEFGCKATIVMPTVFLCVIISFPCSTHITDFPFYEVSKAAFLPPCSMSLICKIIICLLIQCNILI